MRIAVYTGFQLHDHVEGHTSFMDEIMLRLSANHPDHEFFLLTNKALPSSFIFPSNLRCIEIKPPALPPLLWYAWYHWKVSRVLAKKSATVFISPYRFCSLSTSVPQCLIVKDIATLQCKGRFSNTYRWIHKILTNRFLKKARQVVTFSAFSKQELLQRYSLANEKLSVISRVPHSLFQPLSWQDREQVKEEVASGVEFFICTGSIHSQTDLLLLLKAFSFFKKRLKSHMKLILDGSLAKEAAAFQQLLTTFKYRNDVVLTGSLSQEQRARITAAAYAMVYLSFDVDTDLSPLGAFQCSVPVIVPRSDEMTELGGNACLSFDPERYEDLAATMMLLYKDETLRGKLIANGKERVQHFTWDKATAQMWQAILKTAAAE